MNDKIIVYAIPFFLLMIFLEWWVGKRNNEKLYEINDTIGNLFSGISEQAISVFSKVLLLMCADFVQRHFAIVSMPTTWWSVLLLFLLFDFCFYWAHRIGHEINVFWGSHVVHHQSEQYNLSVALRQPWFLPIMTFVVFLPIPLLGFEAMPFAIVAGFSTLFQFWIHTKKIGKLGWFEYLFNTPSHHRVHHGSNPQYIDKNYGAVLIIWDRLFNTFEPEQESVNYGITTPFGSQNAVWANTYYWQTMWNDLRQIPSWKKRLHYIFVRPIHLKTDFPQLYTETKTENPIVQVPTTSFEVALYAVLQCSLVIVGLTALLYYVDQLNALQKLVGVASIVLSSLTVGALLDRKKWAIVAESVRMALLIGSILIIFEHHFLFNYMLLLSIAIGAFSIFWVHYYRPLFMWQKNMSH